MKLHIRLLTLSILLSVIACSSTPVDTTQDSSDYFNQHAELMRVMEKTASVEAPDELFQAVFADFDTTMTEENLRKLYSDDVYFNDTFVTLNGIDELVVYMAKTSEQVIASEVQIVDLAKSDSDYYIRWVMQVEFDARGKRIKSRSIGMTQLRFNSEGKVVLHQDFWDSANAFYQHLPVIGGLVKRVKNGLH